MRTPTRLTARAAGTILAAAILAACAEQPDVPLLGAIHVTEPVPASEVERIQAHLGAVLDELRAADVSHLSSSERARRARHIETLAAYREAGRFPLNTVDPDRPTPVFRDALGTWCAMGYLIASSGAEAVAERIARTRNTAFVWELADDPELVFWLRENGISAREAGRIQPQYGGCCYHPGPEAGAGYATVGTLTAALSGGGVMINLPGIADETNPGWRGGFGVLAGALSLGVGLAGLDGSDVASAIGVTNIGIGAASAALGFRTLLGRDRGEGRASSGWTVAPVARADEGGELRSGVELGLRF